jgi:ABC-type uncharacterized transport system fused permease/ATPase subunit
MDEDRKLLDILHKVKLSYLVNRIGAGNEVCGLDIEHDWGKVR